MPVSTNNCTNRLVHAQRQRKALVLVLVLIVVMMVSLAGFTFAELMFTEAKATRLHGDQLRLQEAVNSGVEQLKLFLEKPRAEQDASGGSLDNPGLFQAVSLEPELAVGRSPANQLRFSVVSPAVGDSSLSMESGIRFGVENESARLHLADLLRIDTQLVGHGRFSLMKLPGMTEEVADAILDWIDPDSESRMLGAESDYYGGLDEPYAPRNGIPDCIEELLLVKGVTRELLFGADANYNRIMEPVETAGHSTTSRPQSPTPTVPWSWLLTVYSGQRNRNAEGQPRINLNSPNLAELHAQLVEVMGVEVASFIVAYRQGGPDATGEAPTGGPVPLQPQFSPIWSLRTPLDFVGVNVSMPAPAGGKRTVYQSPIQVGSPSFEEQIAKLMDLTTADPGPARRGGVSVNDAPASVLQTVPGIDEALAQQIVDARQNPPAAGLEGRRHPTWLLTEGLVDLERMKQLLPYVSAGGDVVRAQVVAHFDEPGPTARAEVVIDATGVKAREVLWRDLHFYGTGYPLEWLTTGAPQGPRR